MKKIILSIIVMVLSAPAFAQMGSGGFSFEKERMFYGVRIGVSFSEVDYKYTDLGTKPGLGLAGVIGVRVSDTVPVFMESGLYYNCRGGNRKDQKLTLHYLDIPVLVKYGVHAGEHITILPFMGPYVGFAVSGSTKGFNDASAFDSEGGMKRVDMGFKFGAGIEYSLLYLELGYQFGFVNIGKNPNDTHTSSFFINFGVNF